MELNLFVYVLLAYCIPFLLYSNYRINPRKGFSMLFISIISTVILLKFSFFSLIAGVILALTLKIEKDKFKFIFYGISFLILNIDIFINLDLSFSIFLLNYVLPISLTSGVLSSMMIGHWFLVDPTISKEGMMKIALLCSILSLLILPLVFFEIIGPNIDSIFKNIILVLYTSAGILSFASYRSLAEKSYTGVMASTGLSYLSLIVSLGASGGLLLLS